MLPRTAAAALLGASMSLAAALACGPVEENVPQLSGFKETPPVPPTTSSSSGGADAGGSSGGGSSLETLCNGGPAAQLGVTDCATSWQTDVFPIVDASCNLNTCHRGGEGSVAQEPLLNGDPAEDYASLVAFQLETGAAPLPYVDLCSVDPAASAITCNLDPDDTCGALMPRGDVLTAEQRQILAAWLACGAPEN